MWRILVILSLIGMWSCETGSSAIGTGFFNGGVLDFSFIDTSTVRLSTIQVDKLSTNGAERLLLGRYADNKLGQLVATPYVQLSASSTIDLRDENVSYNYCALVLRYDQYAYYDTATLSFNVHRLSEEMKLEDGALYNSSTFLFEPESLGSLSISPRPNRDDSVEVKLSDEFGLDIFQRAKKGGSELLASAFLKYMRGMVLVPKVDNTTGVIGFTASPELRVYYTDRSETPAKEKYFSIETSRYFTNISTDRRYTKITALSARARLPAANTDNQAYIQAGAGLALRVDIPYLRELKQIENFYLIRAELEIYPVKKSFAGLFPLPEALTVYRIDKRNDINAQHTAASLLEDTDMGRDTRFALNVTQFVIDQMELQELNENALLFLMGNFSATVNRLHLANPGAEYKTRLIIYYATVND
ncbi:MAG: DUF4270 family protein [Cyclobacteriaceae bacterium]|nr:DUF4270 family protein [Cyclobacteriaceae bacterium]